MHGFFVHINIGIDGQEGMKLIYGIIVVEGKDNQGKVAKVYFVFLFFLFCLIQYHDLNVTNFMFSLFASSLLQFTWVSTVFSLPFLI